MTKHPAPVSFGFSALTIGLMACAGVHQGTGTAGEGAGGASVQGGSPSGGHSGRAGSRGSAGTGVEVTEDAGTCGITKHMAARLPPDVLILLDRSLSMNDAVMPPADLGGAINCLVAGTCPSKWKDMTRAINSSVMASAATINWGLKFFPNDMICGVTDGAAVPVATNNAPAIGAAIAGTQPGGLTPTAAALASAGRYLKSLPDTNPRYVVLATDGEPNCGGDSAAAVAAVTALAAANIPVFVIGVATQGSAGDTTLSSMAVAGGKPRNATPSYYPVAVGADLVAALSMIGTQVISCAFEIPPPPDPSNIAVDVDGMRVPEDPTNGWQYGPSMTSVVLNGSWCTGLQSGMLKSAQVSFACAGVVIP